MRTYIFLLIVTILIAFLCNLAVEEPSRRYLRGVLRRRDDAAGDELRGST